MFLFFTVLRSSLDKSAKSKRNPRTVTVRGETVILKKETYVEKQAAKFPVAINTVVKREKLGKANILEDSGDIQRVFANILPKQANIRPRKLKTAKAKSKRKDEQPVC